jgi:hypothetical protein
MKKIHLFLISLLAIIALSSCEEIEFGNKFLEKEPGVDITKDTIFSTKELALRYLTQGYATLPFGLPLSQGSAQDNKLGIDMLEALTDLNQSFLGANWGAALGTYYNGQYAAPIETTSNNTKFHFSREATWRGIRIGYIFLANADAIKDATDAEKKRLKAEAKTLIALHYVDMYRHFGGLPWVDRAFTAGEVPNVPRLTSKETLNNIVKLLDEAIPDLPLVLTDLSTSDGRFTKASAMGLKARILLFGASPLFNSAAPYREGAASTQKLTWHGEYDKELWKRAADAAKDLISAGGYQLVSTGNFRKDFQDAYYKRGNGEVLISTRRRFRSGSYWDGNYYFYQSADGYGTGNPTKNYVDMFPMANGLPITDPASGYNANTPFENRDPRLYETVLVNGDNFQGRTAELWIGGIERPTAGGGRARSGFGLKKFLLDRDAATSIQSITHWPYLRLAEIYLSYAEALNEYNGGPTTEAYEAVNIVRARVGLAELQPGLDKEAFTKAVLNERACEFGFEEIRWFDLIRWKMASEFTKKLYGLDVEKNTNGTLRYTVTDMPRRFWADQWDAKWYLSAFPPTEVNKGYGLIQNPGW